MEEDELQNVVISTKAGWKEKERKRESTKRLTKWLLIKMTVQNWHVVSEKDIVNKDKELKDPDKVVDECFDILDRDKKKVE